MREGEQPIGTLHLAQLSLGWRAAAQGDYALAAEIFNQVSMESMTPAPARIALDILKVAAEDARTGTEKLWRLAVNNPASCEAWMMLDAVASRTGDVRMASQARLCAEALCGRGEPLEAFLLFLASYTAEQQ